MLQYRNILTTYGIIQKNESYSMCSIVFDIRIFSNLPIPLNDVHTDVCNPVTQLCTPFSIPHL